MLVSNGADYKLYKKRIEEIKPLLIQLANSSAFLNHQSKRKILWLNQFPAIDFWAPIHGHNDDIYAGKIHQYNSILKSVLRYASESFLNFLYFTIGIIFVQFLKG